MSIQLSPLEEHARALIAAFLGVPVTQHDDQTAPRLPDLRIEYPDRPHAVVEIVSDIERVRADQQAALGQRGEWFDVPGLTRSWGVQLNPQARIGEVHKRLPTILAAAEAAGEHRVTALPWSGLDPRGYELHSLGVEWAWSRPGCGPVMLIAPNSYSWDGDPNVITQWCVTVLAREADVAAKLAASPYTERHAFIFASTHGDLGAYRALMDKEHPARPGAPFQLPTLAPDLPPGVDAIWACGERTIAWLPQLNWVAATPPHLA